LENIFKHELLKDEKILWVGQPNPNIIFTSMDWFLIPFSIIWGGFAIFWELSTIGIIFFAKTQGADAPIVFPIFGIPFVIMGLYFIFGRFLYKKWKKKRTYYAVTNKRIIIIIINTRNRDIITKYIKDISTIKYFQNSNGNGTIRFGNFNYMVDLYANTGMEIFIGFMGNSTTSFFDIDNVKDVYSLVNEIKYDNK